MIPCAPRPWCMRGAQQGGHPVTLPHRTGTGLVLPRSTLRLQRKPSPAPPAPPCPGDGGNRGNRRLQPCRGGHGAGHGAGRGQGEVPHMWQGGPWGGSLLHHRHPALLSPPPSSQPRSSQRSGANAEHPAGTGHRAWRGPGPAAHSTELAPRGGGQGHSGAVPAAQGGPAGRWQPRGQQQDVNQP